MSRRRRSLHLGLALGLLLTGGLALWPTEPAGAVGSVAEGVTCRSKLDRLARAVRSGQTDRDVFGEAEINAHLEALLERNRSARQPRGLTLGIEALRMDLDDPTRFFVEARLDRLPLLFRLDLDCDEAQPTVRSARLGRLPFLGPFKWLLLDRMEPLFAGLRSENILWQNTASCELAKDSITLEVAPGPIPEARPTPPPHT